jgi:hypothetical protein
MRLRLDQPGYYEIRVQGRLDHKWEAWLNDLQISYDQHDPSVTLLTGMIADQAALHGLLNHLYHIGLPLILVKFIDNS